MYVGRILAVGRSGAPFVAYRVSSRSFPNRVAREIEKGVAIQPLNPEDMKKNPYIAYNCIRVTPYGVVVSNGSQTDVIAERLEAQIAPDLALQSALAEMGYEKKAFNTPRIAGILTEATGYIGIVRDDGLESSAFELEDGMCRNICTYERNRVDGQNHPFAAESAEEVSRYIYERGVFREMEKPICSAAWMGGFAVCNPHE